MTNDAHLPVADDAVSNRSDDTALDEADSARAAAPLMPSTEPVSAEHAMEASEPAQDSDAGVEPVTATPETHDSDETGGSASDVAAAEAEAEEPVRVSRGPVYEEPQVEEEIRMDWYILKVQSNRERTIAEALERKMRIEGLDRFFDQVIVPTEKVTEFKGGKKKVVERKLYPGYIVVHMHINDDTWFLVRDTPGIGDFTGAAGKPSEMLPHEVERILPKAAGEETLQLEVGDTHGRDDDR